jgi:two-component system, OmpR family, osmolarity sensor histidine kinase EnvZ
VLLSIIMHIIAHLIMMITITKELGSTLGERVQAQRQLFLATPTHLRETFAQSLVNEGQAVTRVLPNSEVVARFDEAYRSNPPWPFRAGIERMRSRAGEGVRVMMNLPGEEAERIEFLLTMNSGESELWLISYRPNRPFTAIITSLIGWLILILVATTASLIVGARWISRPLRNIAQQMNDQRGDLRTIALPKRALSEVQTVVAAYNAAVQSKAQADTTRQTMLAGISHDLRTPLTRMQLRIDTECDANTAQVLSSDLATLRHIIDQFLAYVQLDNQAGLGEPWAVSETVARAVNSYGLPADRLLLRSIEKRSPIELQLPDLGLQRALTNLIDNALAHGDPPVEVQLKVEAEGQGTRLTISVSDSGAGMSAEEFERAKQPFVRLASAAHSTSAAGHSGLGLAIVQHFVEQTNGQLKLSADPNRFAIEMTWHISN